MDKQKQLARNTQLAKSGQQAVQPYDATPQQEKGFVSLRWRFISPIFIAVLLTTVIAAYLVGRSFAGNLLLPQQNVLLQSSRAVTDRAAQLYDLHRQEAQRVAFTRGVADGVNEGDVIRLQPLLESLLSINGLDSIIVTDTTGREVLGVQRVVEAGAFAVSTNTELGAQEIIRTVLDEGLVGTTGLLRTPSGLMLFTGTPIFTDGQISGVALVGQRLTAVLGDLQGSTVADLALYGPDAALLQTTFDTPNAFDTFTLDEAIFMQALAAPGQVPIQSLTFEDVPYEAAYQPFVFGPNTLGVVAAILPDNIPFVTETGRQLAALMAAALAGVVTIVAFAATGRLTRRAETVSQVATELASGRKVARTGMQPKDEISAIGHALDAYADNVQSQQDAMQNELRRQRRQFNHLVAVLESIPGGVVVQDLDGRVLMMNDDARLLLGSQRVFRSSGLGELAQVVGQGLGPALSPGIYALGEPQRIPLDERIVSAQAAAVLSMAGRRLGTVILLRDITDKVRLEQQRELMIERLAEDIQQPLVDLARMGAANLNNPQNIMRTFVHEIARQAVGLQKLIVDMRELSTLDAATIQRRQRALSLETLVWSVANEWRQVAAASGLTLHVIIGHKGLHTLGDEKRLRWALGNLVDNAIKYTLPGGALTLEINTPHEANNTVNLRVRDNGVGITKEDREHAFTRFYRGTPVSPDGQIIRVPGMGQGLYIARQIIESHGGQVNLKSSTGKGTAVYVSLPLTAPQRMTLTRMDMDGETVQMSESALLNIKRRS